MNLLGARIAVALALVALVAIRAPHGQRSRSVRTKWSAAGPLERVVLTVAMGSFVVPIVWLVGGWPAATERELVPWIFVAGVLVTGASLWLFHRSHVDLGTNWSITLEVREAHTLVTHGVYGSIRHPMYTALLGYALGLFAILPNYVAGGAYLVAMLLLVALRLGPEEALMRREFGDAYATYAARTKRLVPGVY